MLENPEVTIVFCRTKRRVDEVSKGLEARGYKAAGLHGDLTQARRTQIMQEFKAGKIDILVATDVAARGIDISGVTHVYNYDIPQDPDGYVHRVGRTGRAGKHGVSITFATPNEMDYLREIEKLTKVRMLPLKPPTIQEAFVGQLNSAESDIADLIKKTNTDKYEKMADKLLEEYEATDLVAALLNDITRDNVKVKITPERPLSRHHGSGHRNDCRGGGHGGHYKGSKNRRNGDRNSSHNRGHYEGLNDCKHSDKRSGSNNKKRRFTIKNS